MDTGWEKQTFKTDTCKVIHTLWYFTYNLCLDIRTVLIKWRVGILIHLIWMILLSFIFAVHVCLKDYSVVLQLSSYSVVEVWRRGCYLCEVRRVTKAGLRVILASPWYLDQPGPKNNWARYYTVWPLAFKGQNRTCVLWLVEVLMVCYLFGPYH